LKTLQREQKRAERAFYQESNLEKRSRERLFSCEPSKEDGLAKPEAYL